MPFSKSPSSPLDPTLPPTMASKRSSVLGPSATGTKREAEASAHQGDNSRKRQGQGADGMATLDDPEISSFYGDAVSSAYRLKSELVSQHLAKIGMGKFQWILFVVTGFGWIVDNFWSQGINAVRPAVALEMGDVVRQSFSSVAYYVGLILGASFWGTTADVVGRKPAFNATIFLGGIFACAVAGSPNFVTFCVLWAVVGTAAGGNVPVDSIVFLEFVPPSHQWLLTMLSAWWNVGQVVVALLSWLFLTTFSCPAHSDNTTCSRAQNMGWRYLMITLGATALAFGLIRIFLFKIPESPRFLLSMGRDADAVEAINYIARYNGRPETLTLSMLQDIDSGTVDTAETVETAEKAPTAMSSMSIITDNLSSYSLSAVRKLFASPKLTRHTALIFIIWLTIGIAYPLYFAFITSYLETKKMASDPADTSLSHSYQVYCIISAVGVMGPLLAGILVQTALGRRWMMALSSILTGVFLFIHTRAETESADIGFQAVTGVLGNLEYAVMYAFTPESFPGPVRGTGTGIAATLLRLGGLASSLISTYSGFTVVPIYISAAMWISVGLLCFGLPFETHGRVSI